VWTILRVVQWATSYLQARGIDSPRAGAELLLAHALGMERVQLYMHHDKPLQPEELSAFKELIRRRVRREPVAYIVGRKGFWTLDLRVTPAVLIPRPETEGLVEAALKELARLPAGARVLDLGTGSGAIVLALAAEAPMHRYAALDISLAAVLTARQNAREAGLAGGVDFFVADWCDACRTDAAPFDLIVANPPYIPTGELPDLQPEIARYEPRLALDGDADGLGGLRAIGGQAHRCLKDGGALILEIGHNQKDRVQRILAASGRYGEALCAADAAGNDRVMVARKKILPTPR
jgi:release factor glutamine methyltransferase